MATYDVFLEIDNEDNPFELAFLSGDFIVDKVDEQNVRLGLLSGKGNWKQFPTVGAEMHKLLHLSPRTNFQQILSRELDRIGYRLTRFEPSPTGYNSIADL